MGFCMAGSFNTEDEAVVLKIDDSKEIQIKTVRWWRDLSFSQELFGFDWRHDVATESGNQDMHTKECI